MSNMAEMLLPLTAALQLLVASPPAAPTAVAQAGAEVTVASSTDRAVSAVFASERTRRRLLSEKTRLRGIYNQQLAEVDRLKRGRASWRRERQLKTQKAKSQTTAVQLAHTDVQLRKVDRQLRTLRTRMIKAIDKELAMTPSAQRTARLRKWRSGARGQIRKRVKKIVLPDARLDELADPEELLEQIALIEQVEAELAREERTLARRANRYASMDALRRKRMRARDMAALDDDFVRRSTGRSVDSAGKDGRNSGASQGGGLSDGLGAEADVDDVPSPPESSDFGAESEPDPGGLQTSSLVLADVVDASTVDALKRADQSSNPATKLRVANQARKQLLERMKNLRLGRERIERHLRQLRVK